MLEPLMSELNTIKMLISLSVVDLKVLQGSVDELVKQMVRHKRSGTRQQLDSTLLLFVTAILAET